VTVTPRGHRLCRLGIILNDRVSRERIAQALNNDIECGAHVRRHELDGGLNRREGVLRILSAGQHPRQTAGFKLGAGEVGRQPVHAWTVLNHPRDPVDGTARQA